MAVTNGRTVLQEAKIRNAGLDRLVHGWTISEVIGHRKRSITSSALRAD
jgi:putative hydrolase of the HAD superfamily